MNTCRMETPAQKIANAIDSAMRAFENGKGIGQAELSRRSGVPQPTISRTLKAKSTPETETLTKLISVLGPENVALGKVVASILPNLYPVSSQATATELIAKDNASETHPRIQSIINRLLMTPPDSPVIQGIELLLAGEAATRTPPPAGSGRKRDDVRSSMDKIAGDLNKQGRDKAANKK